MSSGGSKSFYCSRSLFKSKHKKFLFAKVLFFTLFCICTGNYLPNNHFDFFVFSQRWLPTACIEYIEHHSSSNDQHSCIKVKNFVSWTIHGLWPTQFDLIRPFFCNRSLVFDITKLIPLESELKLNWPNIEAGKEVFSLWKHEWEKHGTCAVQLESLNSENKYFGTALKLYKTFNVQKYLTQSNILPDINKEINVIDLFHVIKNAFGKMPQIHCIHEVKTNRPYLSEIRLCFNKNLELMDCRNIKKMKLNSNLEVRNILTDCPLNSKVIYSPSVISKPDKLLSENPLKRDYYDSLVNILITIRFLQWIFI